MSLYFTMGATFRQITPSHGVIWTPSNAWLLGPSRVLNPNGMSSGSTIFAQMTAECFYTLESDTPLPLKIVASHGERVVAGPTKVFSPNRIRGLPPYQVASCSIQPFGHNRHGPQLGAVPFGEGELCPHLTVWPVSRPTSMPSFILIHPTVWPMATIHQRHRQDIQRSDGKGEPFYKLSPKSYYK